MKGNKKIFQTRVVPALLIITLIFVACGRKDTPRAVAEKYFSAVSSQDFESAREFGTEETNNLLNMMIAFKKMTTDSTMKEVKYDVLRETINGDEAIVYYKEEGKEGELQLPMVKVDGKWKVILTKESINSSDPSMEIGATNLDSTTGKSK